MSRTPATVDRARSMVAAFGMAPHEVAPLGHGLINDTFAVTAAEGAFVLQRVHPVFSPQIHHNIAAVTEHLAGHGLTTPRIHPSSDGQPWVERDGEVWRLMTRVPGVSFDAVTDPAQARAAANLLGRFHSALDDLAHEFVGVRSGVHDTAAHLLRLGEAVDEHRTHRLWPRVEPLAAQIMARAAMLPTLDGQRQRPAHGDPKLNNVLFEAATGPGRLVARCWIDLDTVAPMPLAVELGDAWRSWCNPQGEDRREGTFDLAIFEASLRGYTEGSRLQLESSEREALLHGVEWITLELAARFATDALAERYFGWDAQRFPAAGEHNLVRAEGQWTLHEAVMDSRSARAAVLAAVL